MSRKDSSRFQKNSSAMNSTVSRGRSGTSVSRQSGSKQRPNSSDRSSEDMYAEPVPVIDTESNHSSEVDELKELQMRTGLVKNNKPSSLKMPSLRGRGDSQKKVSKKRTLHFADSVLTSKKGGQSVLSLDN